MKKSILLFFLLIILAAVGFYYYQQHRVATAPSTSKAIPSPTKQPKITTAPTLGLNFYCTADNIDGRVTVESAAGNTYATLTLKNSSTQTCSIDGRNFIQPTSNAKNITITKEGKPGATYLTLKPNQTVYSQVHYPNGPQCSGETETKTVTFAYQISASQTVTFIDQSSNADQNITICKAEDEKTPIQVWSINAAPLQ